MSYINGSAIGAVLQADVPNDRAKEARLRWATCVKLSRSLIWASITTVPPAVCVLVKLAERPDT